MARKDTPPATLDNTAPLLEVRVDELKDLLDKEYRIILSDPDERRRYFNNFSQFLQFALDKIHEIYAGEKYFQVLKRIIHRDEPRHFYFYINELEAVNRILTYIDHNEGDTLLLNDLGLFTLPSVLRRVRNLKTLDISKNHLRNIFPVTLLPELEVLIADDNQINDIGYLSANLQLKVLSLNRNGVKRNYEVFKQMPSLREVRLIANRITDKDVRRILESPYITDIQLQDNPINVPIKFLTDINGLRAHLNMPTPMQASNFPLEQEVDQTEYEAAGATQPETSAKPGADEPNAPNEAHSQSIEENTPGWLNAEPNAPNEAHGQSVISENTTGEPAPEPNAAEPEHEQTIVEENSEGDPAPKSKDDQPPPETKQPSGEKFTSYAIREIQLRGNPKDNLLDIEKLSGIFYNLIANSDSNGEHFFGLFGRWGRGKTFFWKYILNNKLDHKKYIPIEFHAWKYQDTPGIWAYLYNTLNDAYLGDKPKWYQLSKWLKYYKKILLLNEQRGKLAILVGFILSIAIAVGIYFYNDVFKGNETVQTVLRIGIPVSFISMLIYIAKTFKTDARKIMLALTSNVNFNSQLGFQHEIQQELKYLLQAWISEKEKINKRIFLFIDDIDRCSEDKIIQIVDYIRVLLHCPAIQDRVTVLAAIDERILLHAIQDKYKDFIANKGNDATYKELCREYMDKLFLAGLKLGPLTENEKRQIVEGFTSNDTAAPDVVTPPASNGISSTKVAEIISHTNNKEPVIEKQEIASESGVIKVAIPQAGTLTSEPPVKDTPHVQTETNAIPVEPKPIASTARKEFPYEKWEQEFIKEILARNTESTPRSIRVYTYRYLLGKQLVEKALTEGKISWSQWYNTKEAKQCFAIKLLHYGFKSDTEHLLADYRNFINKYDENSSFKESIYGYEISLNQELGSIMFQVLTMIIAY